MDQGWIFGYCLLLAWVILALAFGLGKVEEATSHGLREVMQGLLVISTLWAQWKFNKPADKTEDKEPHP